jgi:hypothetical protein
MKGAIANNHARRRHRRLSGRVHLWTENANEEENNVHPSEYHEEDAATGHKNNIWKRFY